MSTTLPTFKVNTASTTTETAIVTSTTTTSIIRQTTTKNVEDFKTKVAIAVIEALA